jgi:hypothetical protein
MAAEEVTMAYAAVAGERVTKVQEVIVRAMNAGSIGAAIPMRVLAAHPF